ncbi:MAG: adenine deaminase [Planctomycetes bacterium]|nr:adenine deaminase [Planctomycetota bacterium]
MTPELLSVARGDAPADLLIRGGHVLNVFTGDIETANIAIFGGRIAGIGDYSFTRDTFNAAGLTLAPGLIDAHMHVESTMMPPAEFVRLAAPHGTIGAVFDPHEIANVLGIPGIRYLMNDAQDLPFEAMWALSSCVPSSPLETSGAVLNAGDLAPLFDDPRVVALAEMMNFPGAVNGDRDVLEKINLAQRRGRVVDGHAPGLTGKSLQAYAAAGISSDHECTTADEAREKLRAGMTIFIREGSAARNLEALLPLVTADNKHLFCFCTDDRHPADLKSEGHIDHVVRKAVTLGLNPAWALAMGSLHVARHYGRRDLGAIAPGCRASLMAFDLQNPALPRVVWHNGLVIARDGEYLPPRRPATPLPGGGGVVLPRGLGQGSFRVPAASAGDLRVIHMHPHQIVTGELRMPGRVQDGAYVQDTRHDILKLAVIERHRGSGNIGLGFVHGFRLKRGAIASTVGHDSHNLAVVGTNDADMLLAARTLEACGGGQCAVADGSPLAVLPLPIAGLMSDRPAPELIAAQRRLLDAASTLGYPHDDPFMPLSFLVLPVIPALKVTDLGLVDVGAFRVVPIQCA